MKQKVLYIVFLVIMLSAVSAQEEKVRSFSFQANPFIHLTIDDNLESYSIELEFEFQYAINNFLNISLSPQFSVDRYRWSVYNPYLDPYSNDDTYHAANYAVNQTRFIITPGLLYRPFRTRLKGMYMGIYIPIGFSHMKREGYTRDSGYGFVVDTEYNVDDHFTLVGIGGSAGYQWIFRNGFTISLGAGGQKIWSIASDNNTKIYREVENLFKLPFVLTLTFRLGYSF
jgi:hypothetical protein